MLTPSGDVKVMDFGIARAMSDAAQTMTQTAAVVGTAQYLSPEQARGETVDSRSDVYSAGCVLYELLTGRPPFVGDSPVSVAYQHVREQAQPPSAHDPSLPPAIDTIVMKALAKRVSDRYQSAAAMRNDIERFLAGRPVQATMPPVAPPPPADPTAIAPTPPSALFVEDETDRSHMRLLLALGAAIIVLIAIAALLLPHIFSGGSDQVEVPNVVTKTLDEARSEIGQANLSVGTVDYKADDTIPAGDVISQDPQGGVGQYADPGTPVDLVVSNGKPQIQMPNVVGATYASALEQLEQLGLNVKRQPVDSDQPKNQVLSSYPPAQEMVAKGATVTLEVSRGPKQVPDVVGMMQSDAEAAIQAAGFVPRVTPDTASTEPYGTVTSQSPTSPNTQKQGQDVVIWVSQYQGPPVSCPTVNPDGTPADPSTCYPTTDIPTP
jgi:serine/threonine-protein kinase